MNELDSAAKPLTNDTSAASPGRGQRIAGWVLSVLTSLPFVPSAWFKLTKSPQAVEGLAHVGLDPSGVVILGVVELLIVVVYLIPPTSLLGAVLVTGYVGGIVVAHLTMHLPLGIPIVIGVAVWLGLWLREPRLRGLLPVRSR
jgi:hypothetical protein